MVKKIGLAALLLLLIPALACAGIISASVVTGAAGGTLSPKGIVNSSVPKLFTITATPGSTLDKVTLRVGSAQVAEVTATPLTSSSWSYTVQPSGSIQTLAVYFKLIPPPVILTASLGLPSQTTSVGVPLRLTAGASTISPRGTVVSYAFAAPSGGTLTTTTGSANSAGAIATNFSSATAGTYTVTLRLTSGSVTSTDQVTINVQSKQFGASQFCLTCHTGTVVDLYSGSLHATASSGPSCQVCHNPGLALAHPGLAVGGQPLTNSCLICHVVPVPGHPVAIGANPCIHCHNPHSLIATVPDIQGAPHYNNITTGAYPASYVTSRATCYDCHIDTPLNATVRGQWAQSGHAATKELPWTALDFKTMPGCEHCHTTTGFIAYSSGKVIAAWGRASDKTKEVLTCIGCHSDVPAGIVRTVTPVKPYVDDTAINHNVGTSNICMDCHVGINNGKSIKSGNFNNQKFIPPHYLTAAGTLQGNSGYNFPGRLYANYSINSHRNVGMGNNNSTGYNGPCIECHVTAVNKHAYLPVTIDPVTGAITGITTTVCTNCHGADSMTVPVLEGQRLNYINALDILKASLKFRNYSGSFSNTNWGSGQSGANAMGAAYNYKLLLAEPGAYAHNTAYAKQLLIDSIDASYNQGTVTGNISSALDALVGAGFISSTAADNLNKYRVAGPCATCHLNNTGKHPIHLSSSLGMGCTDCHHLTAATDTTLVPGTLLHQNGVNDVNLAAGGSYAKGLTPDTGTCSTVYCHSNGALEYPAGITYTNPNWATGVSNCSYCHPLNSLKGAHAAHIGALVPVAYGDTSNLSTATEYRFNCGSCHPNSLSSHGDGHIQVTLVAIADGSLRSKNDPLVLVGGVGNSGSGIAGVSGSNVVCSAAYCHSNGGVGAALVYAASPNWYGTYTGDKCAMCHANAPATGAHAAHGVSIHAGLVADANGVLIPKAAAVGIVAGHGDPAQSTTIGCTTCHSATVTNSVNDKGSLCVSCHGARNQGPVVNKSIHLNGVVNVAFTDVRIKTKAQIDPVSFDHYSGVWTRTSYKVDNGSYDNAKQSLIQGSWNGVGETCSNIACHNGGTPKWSDKLSCANCHSRL